MNLSDKRVKKDIKDITLGLNFIKSLRPVQYKLKKGDDRTDFGFIAQEIESLVGDNYNILGIGIDADRTLSLRYTDFIAPMVKAMQEQQAIIEQQKTEIEKQKGEIAEQKSIIDKQRQDFEARISRLEKLLVAK
jgi:septal ring factor EnvC (AmiA/AmiB activator)